MKERLSIVKIGGNVIDDPEKLDSFLKDFSRLPGKKILVHGGGKEATRLSGVLGIETVKIDGRRVTDRATLDVVTMVYAGLINKNIVAALQKEGVDAMGFTGADGNLIPATRRPAIPVDYGFVGDIDTEKIGTRRIAVMLEEGIVPVFCAICHDGKGTLLNCNADTIAGSLAVAMAREYDVSLVYCFEKAGVLMDIDDDESVIAEVNADNFDKLKATGVVAEGMLPKLENALASVAKGVSEVRICHFSAVSADKGTVIR